MSKGIFLPLSITDRLPCGSWYFGNSINLQVSNNISGSWGGGAVDAAPFSFYYDSTASTRPARLKHAQLCHIGVESVVRRRQLVELLAGLCHQVLDGGAAGQQVLGRHRPLEVGAADQVDAVGQAQAVVGVGGRVRVGGETRIAAEIAE